MISALVVGGGFAISLSVLQMQCESNLRLPILIFPLVGQVIWGMPRKPQCPLSPLVLSRVCATWVDGDMASQCGGVPGLNSEGRCVVLGLSQSVSHFLPLSSMQVRKRMVMTTMKLREPQANGQLRMMRWEE